MTITDIIAAGPAKPTQARRAKPAVSPVALKAPTSISKSDTVIELLLRTKGATPLELSAATGWQPHSVRAFLSGLRKKGRSIGREPRQVGPAAYRIAVVGVAVEEETPSGPAAASAATASGGAA